MARHIASNALNLLILAFILLGGIISSGIMKYSASGPLEMAMCLKVDPGSSFDRVADDLETASAIYDRRLFRIGVSYSGKSRDLKAGAYLIPAGASMADITHTLTGSGRSTCGSEIVYRVGVNRTTVLVRDLNPQTNRFENLAIFNPATDEVPDVYNTQRQDNGTRFRVAIAEGVTSWQIVQGLLSVDILSGPIGEVPFEGSLAPDSYEISQGDTRADIVTLMMNAQQARVDEVWANRSQDVPVGTQEEMLILASLIEKETGVAEERRQVASVFANRLQNGMRLQTDPTVIYGITRGQGVLGRGLRRSELRRATPWNTYTIDGLPPTPIANPGLASLQAAVNPDETNYLFFVADGTGGHAFATTLAEHNRNVAAWRIIEAERANQ